MRRLLLAFLLVLPFSARADVVDVKTRNTTIRMLVEGPAKPTAVVVIFSGGDGNVEISDDGTIGKGRGNFAVRTRGLLNGYGLATAVLSPPEDNRDLRLFGATAAYGEDIENVMAALRARFPGLPIWMHGTSRGTISIAEGASKIKNPANRPDGIVLSSSVTVHKKYDSVFDGNLAAFTGAALIIHHKDDACFVCPASGTDDILKALENAKPKKVMLFEGGDTPRGDECQPHHYHGFIGLEAKVIDAMVAYIKAPQ